MMHLSPSEEKYFSLLSSHYPSRDEAAAAAVGLLSSLKLPKPTEHFLSDLHGEFIAFEHILRNASGVIRRYIDGLFPDWSDGDRRRLATIVYYPEKKLALLKEQLEPEAYRALLKRTLLAVIVLARRVATKYDQSQVQALLPEARKSILNQLLLEDASDRHKKGYVEALIHYLIGLGEAERYVTDLANLSVRAVVETVHILGDIYDRGEEAEKIMDHITEDARIDIQWGNHDIAWIGAASGNVALVMNVIRIACRYDVLATIEDGYGINLLPLLKLAERYEVSAPFLPKTENGEQKETLAKMHKAVAILQFKAEGQLIRAHPEYGMSDMCLLGAIDGDAVTALGKRYPLRDGNFPTVDPSDPYAFTPEERSVAERLVRSFRGSTRLREHIHVLIDRGSMYRVANGNLLFHGCVPLDAKGNLDRSEVLGKPLEGRALFDAMDRMVRKTLYGDKREKKQASDFMFYLWCGKKSPLFGKARITTFERYFIEDEATHVEAKNPYYRLREEAEVAEKILAAFGADPERGKIINGHTPIKEKIGESPIKARGKVLVIDGGFAHAYRKRTGIAGYTLISNSYGISLATHAPLEDESHYIENDVDITSSLEYVTEYPTRRLAEASDAGVKKKRLAEDLIRLIALYDEGAL